VIDPTTIITDDTTMDEEYFMLYLDSLPPETRRFIALHYQDQWDAVPSFVARYKDHPGLIEQEG
jgi:hypothetical protein